ncbi:MAG: NAD(P)/FAD-dependent oxidoreductase, partial [Clostridium sp.]
MKKVIVIGAGPAGMMAAMTAAKENEVILLDGNERLGKKLFITGKGRCNVTNAKDISEFFDYIPGNPHFLYSALYTYTNLDTMKFFEEEGIKLKVERGGRVFPESDKSSDIIKGLTCGLEKAGVRVKLKNKVTNIIYKDNYITGVEINNNEILKGDYFIMATGGASYPLTGSRGEGQEFSKKIGHNIVKLKPTLVPIVLDESWVTELMGLILKNVELSLMQEGVKKPLFKKLGEMKFMNYGVSGPLTLSASRFIHEGFTYTLKLDFKPAMTEVELDKRIQSDFQKILNKTFKNAFDSLLPQKIIPLMIQLSEIPEDKKINEITKEERRKIVRLLKDFNMNVKCLR